MNAPIPAVAKRLGLTLTDDLMEARRQGIRVRLPHTFGHTDLDVSDSHDIAWALLGVRLAIDHLVPPAVARRTDSPLGFRRTNVRRYHEAPSVYGEELPFLSPTLTVRLFESLTGEKAFSMPGLLPHTSIVLIHEVGLRQRIATEKDGFGPEKWSQARKALFYDAYKLRPAQRETVTDGELRFYRSTEGMMASRTLLFPEFDYDTAQDHGYLSVPCRDLFILASPTTPGPSLPLREALQSATRAALKIEPFGLSDAIFALTRNTLELLDAPSFQIEPSAARFSIADFALLATS